MTHAYIQTLPVTTRITSSTCPKCGTIDKSGRTSCCGRGGFWFNNCGVSGKAKLDHTWYEGIRACKARAQSKTAVGQQLNDVQQKGSDSSNDKKDTRNPKAVLTNLPITTSDSTTIVRQGCEKLSRVTVHISMSLLLTITF